jgi:hypothetical protein
MPGNLPGKISAAFYFALDGHQSPKVFAKTTKGSAI